MTIHQIQENKLLAHKINHQQFFHLQFLQLPFHFIIIFKILLFYYFNNKNINKSLYFQLKTLTIIIHNTLRIYEMPSDIHYVQAKAGNCGKCAAFNSL